MWHRVVLCRSISSTAQGHGTALNAAHAAALVDRGRAERAEAEAATTRAALGEAAATEAWAIADRLTEDLAAERLRAAVAAE